MNKQDAAAVRLILRTAAEAGLLEKRVADEISQNSHIFLRKNHFRWKIQRFEARLSELETQILEMAKLLSGLGLLESSLAKVAARHQDLALELKKDLESAIESLDVELPPDPLRVPAQDSRPPSDDPDGLALGQFEKELSSEPELEDDPSSC